MKRLWMFVVFIVTNSDLFLVWICCHMWFDVYHLDFSIFFRCITFCWAAWVDFRWSEMSSHVLRKTAALNEASRTDFTNVRSFSFWSIKIKNRIYKRVPQFLLKNPLTSVHLNEFFYERPDRLVAQMIYCNLWSRTSMVFHQYVFVDEFAAKKLWKNSVDKW